MCWIKGILLELLVMLAFIALGASMTGGAVVTEKVLQRFRIPVRSVLKVVVMGLLFAFLALCLFGLTWKARDAVCQRGLWGAWKSFWVDGWKK